MKTITAIVCVSLLLVTFLGIASALGRAALDTEPPVTNDNYVDSWHTSDFEIALTATDDSSGVNETYYRINNGPIQNVSADGSPFITTEEANNTLEYWSLDNAGNEEVHHYLIRIKLDKTAPFAILVIDYGAFYTNSTSVTLCLNTTYDVSGIIEMRFSNNDVFDSEPWEPILPSKSWTLPTGDGTKIIYFQIKDVAGLVSTVHAGSILLDTTIPSIETLMHDPSGDVQQPGQFVTVSANVSDFGSGLASVRLLYFTNQSDIGLQLIMSKNETSGLYERSIGPQEANTLVKFSVSAIDNAGNIATDDNAGEYYVYSVIAEFPSFATLQLLMVVTLAAVLVCRRKHAC